MTNSERHRWPDPEDRHVVLSCESRDGNEHHVRQCLKCGMVRITVIPPNGFAWHEWVAFPRDGKSSPASIGSATPPCRPVGVVEEARKDA